LSTRSRFSGNGLRSDGCAAGFGVVGSGLASISEVWRSFSFAAMISAESAASSDDVPDSASFAISPVSSFRKRSNWSVERPSFFRRKASMRASRRSSSAFSADTFASSVASVPLLFASWRTTSSAAALRPSSSSARTTSSTSPSITADAFVGAFFFVLAFATARPGVLDVRARRSSLSDLSTTSSDARVLRRLPPSRRLRTGDIDPFEQHRELVNVELDSGHVVGDLRRENEFSALQPLVHDRVSATRPHQELHLILAPIQKDEDVAGQRVLGQDGAHFIREALK